MKLCVPNSVLSQTEHKRFSHVFFKVHKLLQTLKHGIKVFNEHLVDVCEDNFKCEKRLCLAGVSLMSVLPLANVMVVNQIQWRFFLLTIYYHSCYCWAEMTSSWKHLVDDVDNVCYWLWKALKNTPCYKNDSLQLWLKVKKLLLLRSFLGPEV